MSPKRPLWAELKRRNVFRVGAAYAVVGWLLIEVADTVFPRLGLPDWTVTFVIGVALLGFPLALFLAWAYELTPEGVKRSVDVEPGASVTPQTGRRIDRLILIGALGVIALLVTERLWFAGRPDAGGEPVPAAMEERAGQGGPPAPVGAVEPSHRTGIAVLPFVNMSPDPENEYFADGISEELLNILTGIEGLKVASRTSAFSFKGKDTPIPEIARLLDVGHVLEGSVRKQGQRVRITAQLVEAGSDAHLWSQTYDRELVDIFRVQEEIAVAITSALEDILGTRRVSVKAPTLDLEAYQIFLRGRTRFYQRLALDEAIDDLQFAVDQDPEFAEAWAFLGAATRVVWGGAYPTHFDREDLDARSELAVRRALELAPTLPLALAVRGRHLVDLRTEAGITEGLKLMESAASSVNPDSSPQMWYGLSLAELGYVERALPIFESARDQDPMVHVNHGYLGYAYAVMGREQEAERSTFRGLELQSQLGSYWVQLLAIDAANRGETERAIALITSLAEQSGEHPFSELWAAQMTALRYPSRRKDLVDSLPADAEIGVGPLITASLMFGDADRLFDAIERATVIDVNTMRLSAWLPGLGWLREDPRYFEFMRTRGAAGFWEEHGYPTGCRAVDGDGGWRLDCGVRNP